MSVLQFPNAKTVPDGHLSGPDLCHLAGITYRQLDFWTRSGYLHPVTPSPGSGYIRAYPPTDITRARLVARLLTAGFTARPAFDVADQLLEAGHALVAGIRIDLPQDL